MAPHLVHQFWGSNSDAVSQLLVREVILAEQVEVLPGNRRAMATASRNASRLAVSLISSNFCERWRQFQQMMQFLMSSLQASARPDCGGQRRSGVEGKSKYCLRWKLLKTGDESKASRSTALRIFIRGMRGLLGRGSEPPILQGLPPASRAFY